MLLNEMFDSEDEDDDEELSSDDVKPRTSRGAVKYLNTTGNEPGSNFDDHA